MKVLKFGGTSVANASALTQLKSIIASLETTELVIIVSALGGVTDKLEEAPGAGLHQTTGLSGRHWTTGTTTPGLDT